MRIDTQSIHYENIVRSPEASNNVQFGNYLENISVFNIAFLSLIAYTINTQKVRKREMHNATTLPSPFKYFHIFIYLFSLTTKPPHNAQSSQTDQLHRPCEVHTLSHTNTSNL